MNLSNLVSTIENPKISKLNTFSIKKRTIDYWANTTEQWPVHPGYSLSFLEGLNPTLEVNIDWFTQVFVSVKATHNEVSKCRS